MTGKVERRLKRATSNIAFKAALLSTALTASPRQSAEAQTIVRGNGYSFEIPASSQQEPVSSARTANYQDYAPSSDTSDAWFRQHGYERARRFEIGLSDDGDYHRAYYVPGTAGRDLQVVLVSDDPYSTNPVQTRLAQDLDAEQRGHYGHYRCPDHMKPTYDRMLDAAKGIPPRGPVYRNHGRGRGSNVTRKVIGALEIMDGVRRMAGR